MSTAAEGQAPIEDYAAVGNGHTVALISKAGSIDWWCPMRFDHASVFAALLDVERGGHFRVAPTRCRSVTRRYVDQSNVLETTFDGPDGRLRITDLMPLGLADRPGTLLPHHAILRIIEGLEGDVDVKVSYAPRFAYGAVAPQLRDRRAMGTWCSHGAEALSLRSTFDLDVEEDGVRAVGRITVSAGERHVLSLSYAEGEPLIIPPLDDDAIEWARRTVHWWQRWASRCRYDGPYRDAVVRSALTLKQLIYAPSGAIVASPTTSLPEVIGGVRNWDYRYCWLRDSTLTMRALLELGYEDEAGAFIGWLLHATHLTWPELHVLYDVFGHDDTKVRELDHLSGYRGSRPVRVGNDATDQFQLDVYGEVIGAAHEYIMRAGDLSKRQLRSLVELGDTVCRRWEEPDEGIWEVRTGRRHNVHSKVMCWRALDNLLEMHEHGHMANVPVDRFTAVRDEIRAAVEELGFDANLNTYTQAFGNDVADASLLLLPVHGYVDGDTPKMRSTYAYLRDRLSTNGAWYRYPPEQDDGLPGVEGAFGICGFWSAEYLARCGEIEAAADALERGMAYANDVGLFAEEMDPTTGGALGNFPQAFTHVGLINAALAIADQRESQRDELPRAERN